MYSLDKKVKASISLPIYFILLTGLFITLFLELLNLSMPLALNLIIVITIYILIVLGGVHLIKIPPYVVDGKYDIEDAKKYIKKYNIKMLKILLLITAVLFLVLLILTIFLNLWRNSLI
jgi:hypothetical protein